MRVIIAGSRSFHGKTASHKMEAVMEFVKTDHNILPSEVLCGMARGADMTGLQWAKSHGIKVKECPADWDNLGKSAGYKRNKQMAQQADALVAFWDNNSRGTKHMINLANEYGLKVFIYRFKKEDL